MSYNVFRIYSFECDHPGCSNVQEIGPGAESASLRDALRALRPYGWRTSPAGAVLCPEHAKADLS